MITAKENKLQPSSLPFPLRSERHIALSFPLKKALLLLGDVVLLNLALFLALSVRRIAVPDIELLGRNLIAFNILHSAWLLIFYSFGLYDIERLALPIILARKMIQALGLSGIVTIVLFYAFSWFTVQPKTILLLDLLVSGALLALWRRLFIHLGRNALRTKILLCGNGTEVSEFQTFLTSHPHLGYEVSQPVILADGNDPEHTRLKSAVMNRLRDGQAQILAFTRRLTDDKHLRKFSYQLFCSGVNVIEFSRLYEDLTCKIPVSVITEGWLLDNIREFDRRGFEAGKRILDLSAAILLGIPALFLYPFVALAIRLGSPGPIFFRQKRVGKDGRLFEVTKFRTMVQDAENQGAQWATEGDNRITRIGKFLRQTRIDELPQLWNVFKGEMSFVGPRPERPEFVEGLAKQIPFYETRHLVKPGLTGWAQINFRYGASIEDATEKLQYDLYYIKNRSFPLELSILLKTIGTVLRYEGR